MSGSVIDDGMRSLCDKKLLLFLGTPSKNDENKIYKSSKLMNWTFHYECLICGARWVLSIEDHAFRGTFDRYKRRTGLFFIFLSEWEKVGWGD
jgi:hypothetical protein